jgi:hypothetical protein
MSYDEWLSDLRCPHVQRRSYLSREEYDATYHPPAGEVSGKLSGLFRRLRIAFAH